MNDDSVLSVVVCVQERFTRESCVGSGARELIPLLREELDRAGLENIEVRTLECFGRCERGPNLRIAPGHRFFERVEVGDFPEIIAELQRLQSG